MTRGRILATSVVGALLCALTLTISVSAQTVFTDLAVTDDLTVTDDASFGQITAGQVLTLPFFMASPASPETLSQRAPATGTLRLITYDMEGGTCTAVLRNNTDGVNLATISGTTTHGQTATITSAENVNVGDELKITITAASSGAGLNILAYLVTASAVTPEG